VSIRMRAGSPLALLILSLSLSACGATSDSEGNTPSGADVPDFSGPYAVEFAESYEATESDFVRSVLSDEEISDAEYSEMTERFRQCLADSGIEFKGFELDGSYTTSIAPNGGDTDEIVAGCVTSSGQDTIGLLRDLMTMNPENRDIPTIMAECLVREGAVSPDYDADSYSSDIEGRFSDPYNLTPELEQALETCSADPLGILGEK
jgi:hypothetical protein